jgi:hypothetical protein
MDSQQQQAKASWRYKTTKEEEAEATPAEWGEAPS